jgi:hypothetical protein
MIRAIEECLPRSVRQRCLAHKMRNLHSKVPEDLWPDFKARAAACYQPASPALTRLLRDDIAATDARDLPSAVACLDDDFAACIVHLRFPLGHRRVIRTANLLERLFGEEHRRTKVIPHAFGERAVRKPIYAALIRAAERWRGIRMTEFEQRQLKAIRRRDLRRLRRAPCPRQRVLQSPLPQPVYPATSGLDLIVSPPCHFLDIDTGGSIDCSLSREDRKMLRHSTCMRLLCTTGLVGLLAVLPGVRTGSAQSVNDMVRTLNNALNPGDAQRLEDQARRNGRSQEERYWRDYRAGLGSPDRYRGDYPAYGSDADRYRGDYRSGGDYRGPRDEGYQGYSGYRGDYRDPRDYRYDQR